jgi:formylglycine-generating enzyme required for sulfatase activity
VGGCVSYWGVEDTIGNVQEWAVDFAGQGTSDGNQPADYFGDAYYGIEQCQFQERDSQFPGAPTMGGSLNGTGAGSFKFDWAGGPGNHNFFTGFRCARSN